MEYKRPDRGLKTYREALAYQIKAASRGILIRSTQHRAAFLSDQPRIAQHSYQIKPASSGILIRSTQCIARNSYQINPASSGILIRSTLHCVAFLSDQTRIARHSYQINPASSDSKRLFETVRDYSDLSHCGVWYIISLKKISSKCL